MTNRLALLAHWSVRQKLNRVIQFSYVALHASSQYRAVYACSSQWSRQCVLASSRDVRSLVIAEQQRINTERPASQTLIELLLGDRSNLSQTRSYHDTQGVRIQLHEIPSQGVLQ